MVRYSMEDRCKTGEFYKLGDSYLLRTKKGYFYFKQSDVLSIDVNENQDDILMLKLKQYFHAGFGLYNMKTVVCDIDEIDIENCNPIEYLDHLAQTRTGAFELVNKEENDVMNGRINYFITEDAFIKIPFINQEECAKAANFVTNKESQAIEATKLSENS